MRELNNPVIGNVLQGWKSCYGTEFSNPALATDKWEMQHVICFTNALFI